MDCAKIHIKVVKQKLFPLLLINLPCDTFINFIHEKFFTFSIVYQNKVYSCFHRLWHKSLPPVRQSFESQSICIYENHFTYVFEYRPKSNVHICIVSFFECFWPLHFSQVDNLITQYTTLFRLTLSLHWLCGLIEFFANHLILIAFIAE